MVAGDHNTVFRNSSDVGEIDMMDGSTFSAFRTLVGSNPDGFSSTPPEVRVKLGEIDINVAEGDVVDRPLVTDLESDPSVRLSTRKELKWRKEKLE